MTKKYISSRRWWVYLLKCGDGSLYAGITTDLSRRLQAHRTRKGSRYVASRLPVRLVWSERAPARSAALRREAAIKRLPRRGKLELAGHGAGRGRPVRS